MILLLSQSVDRAYRIGQEKDVVVYRLITCGTVEEKIYRKQVYKGGISRAGMDDGNHYRYFSHEVQRAPSWHLTPFTSDEGILRLLKPGSGEARGQSYIFLNHCDTVSTEQQQLSICTDQRFNSSYFSVFCF